MSSGKTNKDIPSAKKPGGETNKAFVSESIPPVPGKTNAVTPRANTKDSKVTASNNVTKTSTNSP